MSLTTAEIEQQLSEARSALHTLITGQQPVEIRDSSGELIRYTPANVSRLRAYIAELEQLLKGQSARTVRPLRPQWG